MLRSEDQGKTWQEDVTLPRLEKNQALDYEGKPYRPFNRGAFAQDAETGRLFWPATRHASFHPARGAIDLFVSDDDGRSWQRQAVIADDGVTGFNEVSLALTPAGALLAFMRSFGAEDHLFVARAENINTPEFQITQTRCVGHPYHALIRSDGSLLLTYGYRGDVNQIRARLLQPPAYDVDSAREFVLRDGGGSWDIGYPWAVETADGDALVCYYWNEADEAPHIAWSRIRF
jgi:hypothetical protein